MKHAIGLMFCLTLIGCATGPFSEKHNLDASSSQPGTIVSCNSYKQWPDCYNAASQTCPKGYEVISKEENLNMQARSLRIVCK